MTREMMSNNATSDLDLSSQQIETAYPNDRVANDRCPDPSAIVGYLLNIPGSNPAMEQHFKECADCRLELDALRNAILRACS